MDRLEMVVYEDEDGFRVASSDGWRPCPSRTRSDATLKALAHCKRYPSGYTITQRGRHGGI